MANDHLAPVEIKYPIDAEWLRPGGKVLKSPAEVI